jgi:hypothetical protein
LAEDSSRLKVGLAWSGSSSNTTNTAKSVSFNELAPLFRLSGVKFYSLQKGPRVDPPGNATIKPELTDWTDELHDFADTAALISNLDLVISVDTAIAHLAGALGKPVWTLLRFAADWRWFRGRQESPWYPTMKLFRQSKRGDWESVIRRVAEALSFSQDVCDVARNGIGP